MSGLDILRILILAFCLGETEGRVGWNAPPLQATEMWIAHATDHYPAAWLTPSGITYTTEED